MLELNPYLGFNGDCEEAFKFYVQCLGGRIETMMTYGETPMAEQVTPEWRGKIIHARIVTGGRVLMGADAPPDRYQRPQGISLTITADGPAEAERIFQALVDKGKVQMELQKTFFAERFGMLVDRFGISWMVGCNLSA